MSVALIGLTDNRKPFTLQMTNNQRTILKSTKKCVIYLRFFKFSGTLFKNLHFLKTFSLTKHSLSHDYTLFEMIMSTPTLLGHIGTEQLTCMKLYKPQKTIHTPR